MTKLSNEENMFYGAGPKEFIHARELRQRQTKSEQMLWERLKENQLGLKFRRQHPINQYIVDFYCHQKKLIIEVDGTYHNRPGQKEKDKLRDRDLMQLGLRIIRFNDDEVINHTNEVVNRIRFILEEQHQ